jgi:4-amino-4-deoxy-L-arabinose transferase-like glycosyltransferase
MSPKAVTLGILCLILFSACLRIPALSLPHIENDEVIYQALADRVSQNPLDYTLRKTPILWELPYMNYDTPLFHRPPLFVYLLAATRKVLGRERGVVLSLLPAVLTILLLFVITRELYDEKQALIAAAIMSGCPLLLFCSSRVTMDALLVFFTTLTVLVFLAALKRESKPLFLLSGLALGLAALTKEPGMFIVFPCLFLLLRNGWEKKKAVFLALFLGSALLAVSPWYAWFFSVYHTLIPWWARIYPENIRMFSFIKTVVERPWYFYLLNITLCAPVYLFAWLGLGKALARKQVKIEAVWVLSYLIPLTLYGMMGQGYQTRYLLPAMPALAILGADFLSSRGRLVWGGAGLLLAVGLFTGAANAFVFYAYAADIFPLYYFFR